MGMRCQPRRNIPSAGRFEPEKMGKAGWRRRVGWHPSGGFF